MALTEFQRRICRIIADNRIRLGDSYVAGGVALNTLTGAGRISRDIDLFHDTREALEASWDADRKSLMERGFRVEATRERPGFVEARVSDGKSHVIMQWAQDSAYRFFPLLQHEELGLTLHPFDLATNKILALIGRVEVRDWVDILTCHDRIQPLAYIAWAACGKDPGFSPSSIIEHAARTARYSAEELRSVLFDRGAVPDAHELSNRWHGILDDSRIIINSLPTEKAGMCLLAKDSTLYKGSAAQLLLDLKADGLIFHQGRIKGAFPAMLH